MWGGFPKVVREVFPNAKLVVDRFHVMQALTKELNTIRKQTRVTEKGQLPKTIQAWNFTRISLR